MDSISGCVTNSDIWFYIFLFLIYKGGMIILNEIELAYKRRWSKLKDQVGNSEPTKDELSITNVDIKINFISAYISDGRIISIPIKWFPKLENASVIQLNNFEISPAGIGIHWPDVDEDVSIESFIGGPRTNRSGSLLGTY